MRVGNAHVLFRLRQEGHRSRAGVGPMRVVHVHGIAAMRLFGLDIEPANQVADIRQRILHQQRQSIFER